MASKLNGAKGAQKAGVAKPSAKVSHEDIQMQIKEIFEDELYTELFSARCNDSGESVSGK